MRTHFLAWGPCLLAALSFALPHVARADNAGPQYDPTSTAIRSLLVDSAGTPYTAGAGVPVSGPVDQATAGSAAQAWYVRQAPGGTNMSATNPLIVQLTDGSTVYAGPTSAQLPAALVGGRLSVDGSGVTQPVSGSVTVSGTATVTQGTAAAIGAPWPVQLSDGSAALGTAGNPVRMDPTGSTTQPVSGTVTVGTLPAGSIAAGATGTAGTPSAAVVSVQGVASGTVIPVSDGAGSLTVDSPQLPAALGAGGGLKVDGSGTALPVSGTVTLSGTSTVQGSGTAGTPAGGVLTVQGQAAMTALVVDGSAVTQPVSGTVTANAGTGTFAVSAATLPLPSGAATSAKQPALGTAGTASTDVITIQGIASMTPVAISGTVTSSEAGATIVGTSSTIACDTTAVVVDDTSVSNTSARKVELCNPSTNIASIYATGSGGTGGREVLPGACYELLLAASSTPLYCYAASAVSATALETR